MSQIPANEVTQKDLEEWYVAKDELSKLKTKEMILRLKIYKGKFVSVGPDDVDVYPKEGTTSIALDGGAVLKAQRVISREIDKATLESLKEEMREKGINPDVLVEYKPSLKVREYRTLTEEQRQFFDQALIIKDGSPQLEITIPKRVSKG